MKNDFGMKVEILNATSFPQKTIYAALHQCYSDIAVSTLPEKLTEKECGIIIVKRLLEGGKGHFSPIELASIVFSFEGLPHSVVQQLTRSRIGVSYSIQSFRYTSEHIIKAANDKIDIEDVIYLRPIGVYHDREPGGYRYEQKQRDEDMSLAKYLVKHVAKRLNEGMPPEQARGMLPFDYRQHMLMGCNIRSLMAFLDRRAKKNAQAEIQKLAELVMIEFEEYSPDIAKWYRFSRYHKSVLAP